MIGFLNWTTLLGAKRLSHTQRRRYRLVKVLEKAVAWVTLTIPINSELSISTFVNEEIKDTEQGRVEV